MSERILNGPESEKIYDREPEHEKEAAPKHHEKQPESKSENKDNLETIKHKVEKEARSSHEIQVEETTKKDHPLITNQKLKNEAFSKSLGQIRPHLSAPQRAFSKIVHQPIIDRASDIGAKTVARPFSLLTAGFLALAGSTIVLFMAHHYGFRYNLFLFFTLFISGYLVGLILEGVRYMMHSFRH